MARDKKEYHILVIEDNPGDFAIVEDLLTDQIVKPVITRAINYKAAFDIVIAGTAFDIILLDLSLPDKSGQDLISEILQLTSSCPIIIFTGYDDIDLSIWSIAQGIMDYLLKDDLNAVTLYKSILYAIERKKIIAELIASEREKTNYIYTIEDKNKKLLEIAWLQSHVVRAPLARIMMLTDLIKNYGLDDEEKDDMLNNLLDSATELDTVIRDISNKISA